MVGNAAEAIGLRSMRGGDLGGESMKNAIAAHLPDEHYVIRVDGRNRTIDASWMHLEKACSFGIQFPQHDVKVCAQASSELRLAMTG